MPISDNTSVPSSLGSSRDYCVPVVSADTRRHLRSTNRQLLAVPCYRLNTYGRRAFSVVAPQSGTLSRILSGTRPSVETVSGVCLKLTVFIHLILVHSARSRFLTITALYKFTNLLTYLLSWNVNNRCLAVTGGGIIEDSHTISKMKFPACVPHYSLTGQHSVSGGCRDPTGKSTCTLGH